MATGDSYNKIVYAVVVTCGLYYMLFGNFCMISWGKPLEDNPLITSQLPKGPIGWTVKILFSLNLVCSFPLILYPAHTVLENYLYAGWPKSRKRQCSKNLNRSLLVAFIVSMTLIFDDKIGSFLAINGACTCTPITFGIPALFHYKVVAETTF